MVCNLSRAQVESGHRVEILAFAQSKMPKFVERDGYIIRFVTPLINIASTPMSISYLLALKEMANRADVINVHAPFPFADLCILLLRLTKKTVVTYHSDVVRQKLLNFFYTPLKLLFFLMVERIVATSPNYVATSSTLKKFPDKTVVIPIGLYDRAPDSARRSQHHLTERPYIIFIGELRYYKGLFTLLDAAPFVESDIVIVGGGPLYDVLNAIAEKHRLTNLRFEGRVSETEKNLLLERASVLVLPSHLRSEAFGVALIEGSMYQKPLVSCEIGTGTTFVNVHQLTGLVTAPCDAKGLAAALNLLTQKKDLANQYGYNARMRYEANFTVQAMFKGYERLYKTVKTQVR